MMTDFKPRFPARGSALLITLVLVAIATVVLIATFTRVRVSSGIVRSVADSVSASQMVNEAENAAIAVLRAQTTDVGGSTPVWVSRPGEIVTIEPDAGSGAVTAIPSPLHSGLAADYDEGVNLNAARLSTPGLSLITGDPAQEFPVRWIYVRQDGSRSINGPGAYLASNPVIGRFAYWTDDESTKLNTNLASYRNTVTAPSDPSQISLRPLSASDDLALAQAIEETRLTGGIYETPLDIRRASQNDQQAGDLEAARFSLTHANHSPESTFFNEPKIVLTTKAALADGRPYINLNDIPGTVALINRYLTRTDWPIAPGKSYQDKFYAGDPARITQLSLNIIEYVRARESSATAADMGITIPIRGTMEGNDFVLNGTTGLSNSFRGMNRGPRLTELAMWRAGTLNPDGTRTFRLFLEVHLPTTMGLASVDLTKLDRYTAVNSSLNPARTPILASNCYPDAILPAGGYRVVSWTQNLPAGIWASGEARLRAVIFNRSPSAAIDLAPLESLPVGSPTTTIPIPVTTGTTGATTATAEQAIAEITRSVEVDDPLVNGRSNDWVINSSGHTLAAANSIRSVGQPAKTSSPEQDMDSQGNVTDVGVVHPAPAGAPGNLSGSVQSIAELGHIHTGVQVAAASQAGTPWRTLRLQPRHPNALPSNTLPDWALLDVFALPSTTPNDPLINPFPGSSGGKINLNSRIQPFAATLTRSLPLEALMTDLTDPPAGFDPELIARNIIDRVPSSESIAQGRFFENSAEAVFSHPAEVIEAAGMADRGESSEQILKQVIDHLRVKGSVFTIYSVGQALVQRPDGGIEVRGEDRRMTMVERRESGTSPTRVTFRTILSKPLNR